MSSVVTDIIEQSSIVETRDGLSATRVFTVSDVTGAPEARLARAIQHPGIPAFGERHPSLPDLQVTDKRADPIDMEQFRIYVTYAQTDALDTVGGRVVVEVGSTPGSRTTARDKDGKLLTKQVWVEETDSDGNVTRRIENRQVEIQEEFALVTYVVRKRETTSPLKAALRYQSSVDGNWKCTRVSGSSEDGGKTYLNTYELTYNPHGWLLVVEDRDEAGNVIQNSRPAVFRVSPENGLPVQPPND